MNDVYDQIQALREERLYLIENQDKLLEALKLEHQYHRNALGVKCFDCPVCKLIKEIEG